jgi:alpha-glucosidase
MAALLLLALPGSAYVYQGQELGLNEVLDIPADRRQDPIFANTGGLIIGRDGCRVPLPWSGDAPPYGFADQPVRTWLPQPEGWAAITAEAQAADPESMLSLYREAFRLRRDLPALGDGELTYTDAGPDTLVFTREPGFTFAANFGSEPTVLPPGEVLLASGSLENGLLPADIAVWLAR